MSITYIVPHYENLIGLKRLLLSIKIQGNVQIIVVDDSSHEDTFCVLEDWSHKYNFELYKTAENSGPGLARNIGISYAKNNWIIFADSDDYFLEGYELILKNYLSSDADVIYFPPTSEYGSKNQSVRENRSLPYVRLINTYLESKTVDSENNLKYRFVVPWSKMTKRVFLNNNNIIFDNIRLGEDVLFASKIGYYASSIDVSPEPIYCCVEESTSITSDISIVNIEERIKVLGDNNDFLKKNLSKSDYKNLNITGMSYIVLSFRSKYSLKNKLRVIKCLKKQNIPLINFQYIRKFLKSRK